jgi:urea transport system ATP-binding protein
MLLVQDPQVLLLDEPVAGMTHNETERTADLVKKLARERTVVVVEHDMDFVRGIAETVSVLHEGRLLAEGPMEKVQADRKVIEVYLGN